MDRPRSEPEPDPRVVATSAEIDPRRGVSVDGQLLPWHVSKDAEVVVAAGELTKVVVEILVDGPVTVLPL
jgi:hypothetical protein